MVQAKGDGFVIRRLDPGGASQVFPAVMRPDPHAAACVVIDRTRLLADPLEVTEVAFAVDDERARGGSRRGGAARGRRACIADPGFLVGEGHRGSHAAAVAAGLHPGVARVTDPDREPPVGGWVLAVAADAGHRLTDRASSAVRAPSRPMGTPVSGLPAACRRSEAPHRSDAPAQV